METLMCKCCRTCSFALPQGLVRVAAMLVVLDFVVDGADHAVEARTSEYLYRKESVSMRLMPSVDRVERFGGKENG